MTSIEMKEKNNPSILKNFAQFVSIAKEYSASTRKIKQHLLL